MGKQLHAGHGMSSPHFCVLVDKQTTGCKMDAMEKDRCSASRGVEDGLRTVTRWSKIRTVHPEVWRIISTQSQRPRSCRASRDLRKGPDAP